MVLYGFDNNNMSIDLALLNKVSSFEENYYDIFLKIIQETCQQLQIMEDIEVSCIFVDDMEMHEMNRVYRNVDRPTDVISFAMEEGEDVDMAGMPRCLGDIFISVDRAKAQAQEYGHSVYREICFLFTHGLLHLLGFDHMEEEEEKEMFSRQDNILESLQINR